MAASQTAIRVAKDELRKKLKKALRELTEQQKLEQSAGLIRMVSLIAVTVSVLKSLSILSL